MLGWREAAEQCPIGLNPTIEQRHTAAATMHAFNNFFAFAHFTPMRRRIANNHQDALGANTPANFALRHAQGFDHGFGNIAPANGINIGDKIKGTRLRT